MSKDKTANDPIPGKPTRSPRGRRGRRAKVVSLDEWRNRKPGGVGAPVVRRRLSPEQISSLAREQKAAFLLKFILCDDTTDKELDELVLSAAKCADPAAR